MNLEARAAFEAMSLATNVAKNYQIHLHPDDVIQKEDLSLVTVADFICQFLINRHLLTHCPEIPIMGEEDSFLLQKNPLFKDRVIEGAQKIDPNCREQEILEIIDQGNFLGDPKKPFWVVDPIDGTRGYVNKDQYAIALALIDNGEVVLGGLGCPDLPLLKDALFFAIKGQGTKITLPQSQIAGHVASTSHEVIYCEQTFASKRHSHTLAKAVIDKVHAEAKPFRMDSQCKYALVASGQASVYLRVPNSNAKEKIWDHAPGTIVVQEAKGIVSDLRGKPLNFSFGKNLEQNFGIVATTKTLHPQIIAACEDVMDI